jgi:hypothetical protein
LPARAAREAVPAQGALSCPIERYQHKLLRKSCFIVATNELDQAALPDERLKVERGFRFLKDPVFLSSTLFLKTPRRIMAALTDSPTHDSEFRRLAMPFRAEDFHLQSLASLSRRTDCPFVFKRY